MGSVRVKRGKRAQADAPRRVSSFHENRFRPAKTRKPVTKGVHGMAGGNCYARDEAGPALKQTGTGST